MAVVVPVAAIVPVARRLEQVEEVAPAAELSQALAAAESPVAEVRRAEGE